MKIKESRYMLFGRPHSKQLHEWITKTDLNLWNIMVDKPIHVRNFITQYTDYIKDIEQFKKSEYWLEPNLVLETQKDDCEGLNSLCCNILYTLGYDVYLAIGYYGNDLFKKEKIYNHAYGLLKENDQFYILECTSNNIINELPLLENSSKYYTHYIGSPVLQKTFVCNHLAN